MPKINLLNILSGDSQNILIEKVNYNFDQILTAGGGPQGSQGIRGATGPIGPQGIQGPTGPHGLRGARWYVQPVAPSNLNIGSYNNPWGEPELGDLWLTGETGSQPYGVYVYSEVTPGTLGWQYSDVFINTQSAFSAVDDINLTSGERVLIHDTQFSHTYGLLLSDYGVSGGSPTYNYTNTSQYGLNSERAKLKIATDPSSAMATLLSFGRADQDLANFSDPSFSQSKNPRFLWTGATGYSIDLFNPGGDINIRPASHNFTVSGAVDISLSSSSSISQSSGIISFSRIGASNSFINSGTGAYYADGSVIRYSPNYSLANGNFIVGDAVSANGGKGLVISSSSAGRFLIFKSNINTSGSVYGKIAAETQAGTSSVAGISFAIDGSSVAESRIDFSVSSSAGSDVTRLRLNKDGNLQFRFGSISGSSRNALIFIQESSGTDSGADLSVRAGSSQGGSYSGGTLYLSGGTGGSVSGKSGNVVINPGFVGAAGSSMAGSIYLHSPIVSNKTNVTGVGIGLDESVSLDAALVVADTSYGISGGDIVRFKTYAQISNGDHFFGFDSDGYLTKGLPFSPNLTGATGAGYNLSSDVNNLDYYEEGDWSTSLQLVPRVVGSTGWTSSKYKIVKSRYTRIGDTVNVDFVVKIDSVNSPIPGPITPSEGYMYIKGFPYDPDFSRVLLGSSVSDYLIPSMPIVPIKATGFSNLGSTPAGTIQAWPSSVPPVGWLVCDGSEVSRITYAGLFSVIGTTYGAGDLSTTFNLPDLRGKFIRGLGGNSDALGVTQLDGVGSHTHTINVWGQKRGTGSAPDDQAASKSQVSGFGNTGSWNVNSNTGSPETRPLNMAMNYIIYAGSISSLQELGGAFVSESSESRFYLYTSGGNLPIDGIPAGSTSYLHGSFSYKTLSSIKYGGIAPPPGPTPPPPPPPSGSACDSAPVITSVVPVSGTLQIYFTLASGTPPIALTVESSTDGINWTPSSGSFSSPRVVTEPLVTTYYRLIANCSGSINSDPSATYTYTVSAPPVINNTGIIDTQTIGRLRITLSSPATCNYSIPLSGNWFNYDTFESGTWTATYSISSGFSVGSPFWGEIYDFTTGNTLSSMSGNFQIDFDPIPLVSSQCSGGVQLTLTA